MTFSFIFNLLIEPRDVHCMQTPLLLTKTACHFRNEASPLRRPAFTRPRVPSSVPDRRHCQHVPVTFVPNLFTPTLLYLTCCGVLPLIDPSKTETGTVVAGEGDYQRDISLFISVLCSSLALSVFFVFSRSFPRSVFFLSHCFLSLPSGTPVFDLWQGRV